MRGICLRCGNFYSRLDTHLKSKNICDINYVNVKREEMIVNYDHYYKEYKLLCENRPWKCEYCNKNYKYQSSLSRHKSVHVAVNGNNNIIVNGDHNTINNTNNNINVNIENVNINLNNYGEEAKLSTEQLYEVLNKSADKMIPLYVKSKHIDIEENRNLLFTSMKNKYINVYIDNNWNYKSKNDILEELFIGSIDELTEKLEKIISNRIKDLLKKNPGINVNKNSDIKSLRNKIEKLDMLETENKKDKKNQMIGIMCQLYGNKNLVKDTKKKFI
jgi:hypothetical protein